MNKKDNCIHFINTATGEYYGYLRLDSSFSIYSLCFAEIPDDSNGRLITMLLIGCRGSLLAWAYDLEDLNGSDQPKILTLKVPTPQASLTHIVPVPIKSDTAEAICYAVSHLKRYGKTKVGETRDSDELLYEIRLKRSVFESNESSTATHFRVVYTFRDKHVNVRSLFANSNNYIGLHCENAFVIFQHNRENDKSRSLFYHSEIRQEAEIVSAAFSDRDIALSFPRGDIAVYTDYFQSNDRYVNRTFHWHPKPPTGICFYNDVFYSVGEEAVLLTWNTSSESVKPIHTLPRLATSPIITMTVSHANYGEAMLCMMSWDGEVILTSGNGNYRWTVSGIPYCALNDNLLNGFQSNSEGTAVMWAYKNQVQSYDVRRNIVSSRVSIPFNYLPHLDEDTYQSCPTITYFCEFGDWLVASVLSSSDFGTQETLNFYKDRELHSIVPGPHSQVNFVNAMAYCEKNQTLVTASIGEGVVKRWNLIISIEDSLKKEGWRCTSKFQFGSSTINESESIRLSLYDDILCVSVGNNIQVWDHSRGVLLKRLSCKGNQGIMLRNANLFTVSKSSIQMWNLCSGRKWGFGSDSSNLKENADILQAAWAPVSNQVCVILREKSAHIVCVLNANNGELDSKIYWIRKDPLKYLCCTGEEIYALTRNGTMIKVGKDKRKKSIGLKRKEQATSKEKVPKLDLPTVLQSSSNSQSIVSHEIETISTITSSKKQRSVELPALSRSVLRGFL